jgi:tetratricopeptide (TPR) repeat protein
MAPGSRNRAEDSRIESWKEIAAYFGRDERTVRRWEKTRSLPIHRLPGEKGGVFAYRRELTVWLNSASADALEPATATPVASKFRRRSSDDASLGAMQEAAVEPVEEPQSSFLPGEFPELAEPQTLEAAAEDSDLPEKHHSRVVLFAALAIIAFVLIEAALARHSLFLHFSDVSNSKALNAARPVDSAAQEAYLKGRYYWNHRTDGSLRQAVDAFTQAVVRDPNYAPAYAGLADSYNLMPQFSSMPKSQAFPLALAAARKAVALDDSLSEAHRALAFALFYWDWDVNAAFREYQRAIELDPKDVEAYDWYANSLQLAGRGADAVAENEKARELDPTSRVVLANEAFVRFWAGERVQSVAKLKELEGNEPDYLSPPLYLAQIFFVERDFPAYIAELKRAAAVSRDPERAVLAEAAERGWSRGGERGLLEQLRDLYRHGYETGKSSSFNLAHMCALLGEKADADRYLQTAVDADDYEAMTVFRGDFNDRMAGDPGFEQIKQKIRLRMYRSPVARGGA